MDYEAVFSTYNSARMAARAFGLKDTDVTINWSGSININLDASITGEPQSFVYFIRCNEFVKIGTSFDPWRRMTDMVSGNPYEMQLVLVIHGTSTEERDLHRKFKSCHHQLEWFRYDGELKDWIEDRLPQATGEKCIMLI
jgi:Meiotically up-regulated gene 113